MRDVQKDLLVGLLREILDGAEETPSAEKIADHLLKKNVFALPCGIGDVIYKADALYGYVSKQEVTGFVFDRNMLRVRTTELNTKKKFKEKGNYISVSGYGRVFFATRQEAKKALEEKLSQKGDDK